MIKAGQAAPTGRGTAVEGRTPALGAADLSGDSIAHLQAVAKLTRLEAHPHPVARQFAALGAMARAELRRRGL